MSESKTNNSVTFYEVKGHDVLVAEVSSHVQAIELRRSLGVEVLTSNSRHYIAVPSQDRERLEEEGFPIASEVASKHFNDVAETFSKQGASRKYSLIK